MFLVVLCCCFYILSSRHLPISLLVYFVGHTSWALLYLGFSPTLYGCPLFPLVAKFLSLFIFSGSYHSPRWLPETSSVVQKMALQLNFVLSPLPADWSFFLRALHLLDSLLSLHLGAWTRSPVQGGGTCRLRMWGFGGACRPVGGSSEEVLPQACGWVSCWSSEQSAGITSL